MERPDTEMASASCSEPSQTPPQSPRLGGSSPPRQGGSLPPSPPPPPSMPALLPSSVSTSQPEGDVPAPDESQLSSYFGSLDSLLRTASRQAKWAMILILPKNTSSSRDRSTSPIRSSRPAWGPNSYHQPQKIYAKKSITDKVILWRRFSGSAEAERYCAFFPTDGLPHVALLDPRSGERLAVWGNQDEANMDSHKAISKHLWEQVTGDLHEFLESHSLIDDSLGPAHHREKSWAVRTRRVAPGTSSAAVSSLPSTSIMDDEDAAIAAAIAASLAQAHGAGIESSSSEDGFEDPEDEREEDMYSTDSMTQDDDYTADRSSEEEIKSGSVTPAQSTDREVPGMDISPLSDASMTPSRPVAIPSRGCDPVPSSVESLSSSYVDRMESCLRSSTDPMLLERRRLRQEQDDELARSLQEDRLRIQAEEADEAYQASQKDAKLAAEQRLPHEPSENAVDSLTIALRLPGGVRVARRFHNFDKLMSVADFAVSRVGCTNITDMAPTTALKIPGIKVDAMGWGMQLKEMGLSSRTMFILNIQ